MKQNIFAPGNVETNALATSLASLYSGDPEAKRAEREAMLENRKLDQVLKRQQIEEHQRKKAAEDEAKRAGADAIVNIFRAQMGSVPGGDAAYNFYKSGGKQSPDVAGRPVNDDEGFAMPLEPMPRPAEYTPQKEGLIGNLLTAIAASGALPGKTNFEQAAKGAGELQAQGHRGAIVGDATADPLRVSQAYFATSGKAPFSEEQGRVLNNVIGTLNESGAFAQANVGKVKSEAAENYAQARRYGRDDAPLVQVPDPTSRTGFKWSTRGAAVGQGAPIPGAASVKDAFMPTTPNVTQGQRDVNDAADTMAMIAEARVLAQDPRNFGASGILRSTVQDMIAQGDALAQTLGARAAAVQQDVMALGSDVGLENFDTKIPQLDLMTNLLAFRLAKMNDPGGRVTDQDFRIAKSKITGGAILGSQPDFLSRLDLFERTLQGNTQRRRTFLEGRGQAGPITPANPAQIQYPPAPGAAPKRTLYDAQGNRLN